jgi:hypothetical protein
LNAIESLWSVLQSGGRNRFPLATSLRQHEDVLKEEWYKIPLETVKNLYESILGRIAATILKGKGDLKPHE